jgi:hypothetical protein
MRYIGRDKWDLLNVADILEVASLFAKNLN